METILDRILKPSRHWDINFKNCCLDGFKNIESKIYYENDKPYLELSCNTLWRDRAEGKDMPVKLVIHKINLSEFIVESLDNEHIRDYFYSIQKNLDETYEPPIKAIRKMNMRLPIEPVNDVFIDMIKIENV